MLMLAVFLSNHDMARIADTLASDRDKIEERAAGPALMTMNGSAGFLFVMGKKLA